MSRTRQGTDYKRECVSCVEMKTMESAPGDREITEPCLIEPDEFCEPIKTVFRQIKPKIKTVVFDLLKNEEFIIEPWVPGKKEVFRLTTEIGKRYEYAEYTEKTESPIKYFAPTQDVKIVGTLVKIKEGGFGDGGWRIDVFDNDGETTEVKYSYEGRTCFNEL